MSGLTKHARIDLEEAPDNPLNIFLDTFRLHCQGLDRHGLGPQARSIFASVFPPPPEPPPAPAPVAEVVDEQPIDELETQMLIDACKYAAKFKMTDGAHNARNRIKTKAEADLAAAIKRRKVA